MSTSQPSGPSFGLDADENQRDGKGAAWLRSLARFGEKPGLERTISVLDSFGRPDRALKFFHIAGTNGKGSVCAYLASILSVRGKVGLFTSPGLGGYRGRFFVNDEPLPTDAFERLANTVRDAMETATPADPLTEFEALTVMAVLYFAERQVDYVVWETGLGGRYDSTNVVSPAVTAITNVSLDHTEVLGSTIAQIARDKAGIIKSGVPVITAARDEAYLVIEQAAQSKGAPLYRFGSSFGAVEEAATIAGERLSYRGLFVDLNSVQTPLFGRHQVENAAVALAMYEASLSLCQQPIPDEDLRLALKNTHWPGRFEVWQQKNGLPIVLDGAHNPEGAQRFAEALARFSFLKGFAESKWKMVIGVLSDKDVSPMLSALLPYADSVIVTSPRQNRALRANDLAKRVQRIRKDLRIDVEPDVAHAMKIATSTEERAICCWGSLYTVEEARDAMKDQGIAEQGR